MPPRFRAAVAVYALLTRDDQLLLVRRAGSGYHDGELSLPAGHVEEGEDAVTAVVREVHEELGLVLDPAACHLALTGHSGPERPGDDTYVDLFFLVSSWSGEPVNAEPDRCQELVWVTPDALPADVIPFVADAVAAATRADGPRLLRWHWPSPGTGATG